MRKITYLIYLIITIFSIIACEDDKESDLNGFWGYEKPYFEFEYVTDTIHLGMAGHPMSYAVEDLKKMFQGIAATKMQEYFKGIDFYSSDSLLIKAQISSGIPFEIHANYLKDAQYLEIKLSQEELSTWLGNQAAMIPAISLRCVEKNNQMILYFNEVYLQIMFENVQIQKMLLPMLAKQFNPRFDMMPESVQQSMIEALRQQISAILDNIQKLSIGFILVK